MVINKIDFKSPLFFILPRSRFDVKAGNLRQVYFGNHRANLDEIVCSGANVS